MDLPLLLVPKSSSHHIPHQRHHRTYQEELFHGSEANDWPMSGQGGIHQLPSRTGRNEGGYFVGLLLMAHLGNAWFSSEI